MLIFGLRVAQLCSAALIPLGLLALPAAAQEGEGPPPATVYDGDWALVGAGIAISPSYDGSDDYVVSPLPFVAGSFGGVDFSPRPAGIAADLIPDRDGARVEFIAGPALRVRLDRSRQIEDEVVEALGERDVAVEVGPTVGLSFNQLLSPFDSLTVAADFRWDVAGAHDGFVIAPSVSYFTPVSRAAAVILSVGAEHVDGDYADYYFDVSPGQSLASGLPVFDADSGWKNVGVNALVSYDLGGDLTDGGLSVNVAGGYSRMLEDAKRTPSTSIRGDADQWFGGIGLAYTF